MAKGYWQPLYLYLRKRGQSHDDACDSVQGFFEFIVSSGFFAHVGREGGKFRSYLLRSLERWCSRDRTRSGALKRGGGVEHVPLDGIEEMERRGDVLGTGDAQQVYDREWAAVMVRRAGERVRGGYEKRGRERWFDLLRAALPGGSGVPPYPEVAAELGASEGAVKKAVFDLRAAFAEALKEEIRSTVRSREEAEQELSYLVGVLAAGHSTD